MKNINVKKVVAGAAALALGVGVLGVAIAGNNNGTTFGTVAQSDVYTTSSMTPKVSIVTGTIGDDDAWAQNIANAIASNAKRENPDYDSWVPTEDDDTTTVISDDGTLYDDTAIGGSFDETLDKDDYSLLYDVDVSIDDDEPGVSGDEINVEDTLKVRANVAYDDDEDIQAITATINKGDIIYTIEFDDGIPYGYDGSGTPKLKFSFLGKQYQVDELNSTGTKLELVESQGSSSYAEGDTFSPESGYKIEVTNILEVQSDKAREVLLTLKDNDGTVIDQDVFTAGNSDIFEEYLDATVDVDTVYTTQVRFFVGSSGRLELNNGDEIEDFPNKDDELWKVSLEEGDTNYLGSIVLTNNHKDVEWKDSKAIKIGEAISLPNDFAKIKFLGLTEENTTTFAIEDGIITYVDDDEEDHSLFIYNYETGSDITEYETDDEIDGHTLYFEIDAADQTVGADTATAKMTIQLDSDEGDYLQADGSWDDDEVFWYIDDNSLSTTIGVNKEDDQNGWLGLSFDAPNNDALTLGYGLFILEDSNKITKIAVGLRSSVTYDIYENDANWTMTGVSANVTGPFEGNLTYAGSKTNETTLVTDDLESALEFTINDGQDTKVYIDAYTGALVDTSKSSLDYDATSVQVDGANVDLDQDSDEAKEAHTNFGSFYYIEGDAFGMDVPEDPLHVKMFIGGGTTSTGGTEENPYDEYIMTPVTVSDLLKKDSMAATGTLIVVGGHLANTVADGITNDSLAQEGQWIMGKHSNGNIYVAGWTKADTGTAAGELVTTINGW